MCQGTCVWATRKPSAVAVIARSDLPPKPSPDLWCLWPGAPSRSASLNSATSCASWARSLTARLTRSSDAWRCILLARARRFFSAAAAFAARVASAAAASRAASFRRQVRWTRKAARYSLEKPESARALRRVDASK